MPTNPKDRSTLLTDFPVTMTVAACVVIVVLAIAVVFCTALIRALPADVPRIMEPFAQLCAAVVKALTRRGKNYLGDDQEGER